MKIKNKKNTKIFLVVLAILIALILIIGASKFVLKDYVKQEIKQDIKEKEQIIELDKYIKARENMVENQLKNRNITDKKVLDVMNRIERHRFVPLELQNRAYNDNPLPIGYGQTISQPYIVALMTQSLQVNEDDRILEIGTGSGYQAAVLADLVKQVYTIEIVGELADSAEDRLNRMGYKNVKVKNADGYFGWEENAPFDAIIVTAAANHIPPPLLQQLKHNGKLIIPLGSTLTFQTLMLITKTGDELETEFITGVRFVPLTGEAQKR